jgi:hypothetical protein
MTSISIKFIAIGIFLLPVRTVLAKSERVLPNVATPVENIAGAKRPDFSAADVMARLIVEAISAGKAEIAVGAFFPKEPFLALKDMFEPDKYYLQLRSSFAGDLMKHKAKLADPTLAFASFKPGFCKWKGIGSEYNRIPYWSCYHNKVFLNSPTRKAEIDIRVMINWGKEWFVTHLGHPS